MAISCELALTSEKTIRILGELRKLSDFVLIGGFLDDRPLEGGCCSKAILLALTQHI
jgi:hypothetical protein